MKDEKKFEIFEILKKGNRTFGIPFISWRNVEVGKITKKLRGSISNKLEKIRSLRE